MNVLPLLFFVQLADRISYYSKGSSFSFIIASRLLLNHASNAWFCYTIRHDYSDIPLGRKLFNRVSYIYRQMQKHMKLYPIFLSRFKVSGLSNYQNPVSNIALSPAGFARKTFYVQSLRTNVPSAEKEDLCNCSRYSSKQRLFS